MTISVSRHSRRAAGPISAAFLALALLALSVAAGPARADDTTPPQVLSFGMSPAHFSTEAGEQAITATATISDLLSGVRGVSWELYMPASSQPTWCGSLVRTSGDLFSGTYTGQIVLPEGSHGGVYVSALGVSDQVGNTELISATDMFARFGGASQVTNDAADFDDAPPQVTSFSVTPRHVDTSQADREVTVTITIADEMSGVRSASAVLRSFARSSQTVYFDLRRVSGNEAGGVYAATAILPRGSAAGKWGAELVTSDRVTNYTVLWLPDMQKLFGASAVEITNDAAVWDGDAPVIVAYRVTPTEIDTSGGPQRLDVTFTVADAGAGISYADGHLQPLVGWQDAQLQATRVSGDDALAVYEGSVTIPRYAKEGIWTPWFSVQDKLGNQDMIGSEDLQAALPGAEGLYVVNTAVATQITIDRAWSLRSGANSVRFQAGTVVTRRDGGSFEFARIAATPFTIDDTVPTTDLDGTPVATLRFGIPGLNLAFSKEVFVGLAVGSRYNGYRMRVQSLAEDGTAWADETTGYVEEGRLVFPVTHATRFAASLSAPRLRPVWPASASARDHVTLKGSGFGKRQGSVRFGGRTLRPLRWTPRAVSFAVPAGTAAGKVRVRVVTRTAGASNARTLHVTR